MTTLFYIVAQHHIDVSACGQYTYEAVFVPNLRFFSFLSRSNKEKISFKRDIISFKRDIISF